jgi:phenylacetic acid degradation protein
MTQVYSIDGVTPVVDPSAYVHPSAVLIGDVIVGAGVFIGPHASLRGDYGRIVIAGGANVQDCAVLHGYPGADTVIGEDASVGHGAVVHSARLERGALVGMNAVVNDYAVIGEQAVVAAMAFVRAEMVVPPRTLVAGIPAKIVRELADTALEWKKEGTRVYQDLTRRCLATMRATQALSAPEPNRPRIRMPEVRPLSDLKKRASR